MTAILYNCVELYVCFRHDVEVISAVSFALLVDQPNRLQWLITLHMREPWELFSYWFHGIRNRRAFRRFGGCVPILVGD